MPTASSPRVIIAGGSGFLGLSLARHLAAAGSQITILSRTVPTSGPWKHVSWDARTSGPWCNELNSADALVNLVGRTVDCIKTPDHCDEILRSRVEATRVLGIALKQAQTLPKVWVQMSTAHAYGDPPTIVCLMRTDPELALYGRYLVSRRLREEGFEFNEFKVPSLPEAPKDLCS